MRITYQQLRIYYQLPGYSQGTIASLARFAVTDAGGRGRGKRGRGRRWSGCRESRGTHIWKPIPVRIFVIYQGYVLDILSVKSYDIIYHKYDMDIPNANNLEWHILVIYFLSFGQIFCHISRISNVINVGYPNHKYFRMS